MIESDRHQTPFSIGLLGGWGTGKSSIKELYRADLASDAVKQDGRRRSERFHCITFNAWRFGGRDHDIKRALLRHVFLELGGEEDSLQDRLFRQISETTEQPKSWCAVTGETLRAWLIPLPALVVVFAFLFAVLLAEQMVGADQCLHARTRQRVRLNGGSFARPFGGTAESKCGPT